MRRLPLYVFALLFTAALMISSTANAQRLNANAGNQRAENEPEYVLEFPSDTWKAVERADTSRPQSEYVYGERSDGYFRLRKQLVETGTSTSDLAQRDQDRFRFKSGYVEGKTENFSGRLNGAVTAYEYTLAGKPMIERIYYLQADNRTIYVLQFSGQRDKLLRIRNQTDQIARTFRLR